MTSLVIETLRDELIQEVKFNLSRRYQIASIAPYLYMHNAPEGLFYFSILKDGQELTSFIFTSEDIKTKLNTPNNYAHVFFPFVPNNPFFLEKGEYSFKLSAEAYHPNSVSFLAWVKQHENLNNETEYVLNGHENLPLSLRVKEYIPGIAS